MVTCPICGEPLEGAVVVCGGCGEDLPLRVVMVSQGSHGGGFLLVAEEPKEKTTEEEAHGE